MIDRTLTLLESTARRLERGLPKLDAAIERLAGERLAASQLSNQILQRVADERAQAEQEQNQAAELEAVLERLSDERRMTMAEAIGVDALAKFIAERLHEAPGHLVSFTDFYARFKAWLPANERNNWSQIRVSRKLPRKFQTGKGTANKVFLINCAWQPCEASIPAYIVADGKIRFGSS